MDPVDVLKSVSFLRRLDVDQLRAFARIGDIVHHRAGARVIEEGEHGSRLFILLKGRVAIQKRQNDGVDETVDTLGPSDYFGEMALFDGSPRSASVTCLEESTFQSIGKGPFARFLLDLPDLFIDVLADLSAKLRFAHARVLEEKLNKQRLQAEIEIQRHRSIAQMVAGVAHEINTPLGVMRSASSLISERLLPALRESVPDDARTQEMMADLDEAARLIDGQIGRAHSLIESFKKVSVDQFVDEVEDVELVETLEEITRVLAVQLGRSGLGVEFQCDLQAPRTQWRGSPRFLTQVVMNLVSNAERHAYSSGEEGRITLHLDRKNGETSPFVLRVQDYGKGISQEDLPRIFDAFFTTGRGQGGSGLGLAIVHNLVHNHLQGRIDVQSTVGQGTTFELAFPPSSEAAP